MSEQEKKPRPMQAIQADFQKLALTSGDLTYKIQVFKDDLALVHKQMKDLNFEAIASQAAEAKAKQAAATAPVAAPTTPEVSNAQSA